MATVIYEPRDERWAELGAGIERGAAAYMKKKQEEEDKKKLADILGGVQQAPDRETALGIVAASASSLKDPTTISLALRLVDEAHPLADNSLVQGHTYDAATGNESPFWFKRSDVDKVKDPNFIAEMTGRDPSTFTMTKPAKIFDYVDPETGVSIGTFVPGMQPQGVVTSQDFQRARQQELDERAIKTQELAAQREERLTKGMLEADKDRDRSFEATERHRRVTEAKSGKAEDESKELKRISTEQDRLRRALDREAINAGATRLADGTLDLDSMDRPSRQIYLRSIDEGTAMLEDGRAKVWGQALRSVHKLGVIPEVKKSGPSKKYQEYLDAYKRAEGNPELQKKITKRARELGVVK